MSEDLPENGPIEVGHAFDSKGVYLLTKHPVTGDWVPMLRVEPEFARRIAMRLTIASYECEDLRRKSSGG